MEVIDQLQSYNLEFESVITIGAFDGVHRGHQALLCEVVGHARSSGRKSGVVTFHPHPANVLGPQRRVRYLTTPGEKIALLEQLGIDFVALIPFTRALAAQPPAEFVQLLLDHLHPRDIWVGQDFALGKDRAGDARFLTALGEQRDFAVHVLEPVIWDGQIISSSRIRRLLAEGELGLVTSFLGRYYSLAGEVVRGHRRGHELGFPTANLEVREERALPRGGVLACFARLGTERFPAVANLGVRPTFEDTQYLLEVHLLDVDIDLYGCDLVVDFVQWLRPELKFTSVVELIEQMNVDLAETRSILREASAREYHLDLRSCETR